MNADARSIISNFANESNVVGRANAEACIDEADSRDGDLFDYVCGYAQNLEDSKASHADYLLFDDVIRAQWPDLDW
jgi:hypothetical protein